MNIKNKVLTKDFLIEEYINNKKTIPLIAKETLCSMSSVRRFLIKHQIILRKRGSLTGENAFNYKHGKLSYDRNIKYYCINNCNREVSMPNIKCRFCAIRERFQNPKNTPRYIDGRTTKPTFCIDCGKKLSYYKAKRCLPCKYEYMSKNFSGKNHWGWKDGTSLEEYGAEFDNALREQVRMRDNYKCRECGCSQVENGRQLSCHHIDYNKKNNDINNLISLCISCHTKTNHNRNYYKEYFNNAKLEKSSKTNKAYHRKQRF